MHISQVNKQKSVDLRKAILRYLSDNISATQRQVCDNFGISRSTAASHVRAIKDGWRPSKDGGK